jgi:hypothetical protein
MNYDINGLEFTSIVHALKMWTTYLMGKKFQLRTNHSGLKYIYEQPTLNSMQEIWMEFLSEYEF